jgi:hypothetical protein
MRQIHKSCSCIHDWETFRATHRTLNQGTDRRICLPLTLFPGIEIVQMPSGKVIPRNDEIGLGDRDSPSKRTQGRQSVINVRSTNGSRLTHGMKLRANCLNPASCPGKGHRQAGGGVPSRRRSYQDSWFHRCLNLPAEFGVAQCVLVMISFLGCTGKLRILEENESRGIRGKPTLPASR